MPKCSLSTHPTELLASLSPLQRLARFDLPTVTGVPLFVVFIEAMGDEIWRGRP